MLLLDHRTQYENVMAQLGMSVAELVKGWRPMSKALNYPSGPIRRRTDPEVVQRIRELTADCYTGPSIERLLSNDYADRTPSLRTIQSIMRDTPITSEWWSVAEASAEEARLVLPVLADRIEHLAAMEGVPIRKLGTVRIARDLAFWIAKIRAIEPSLEPRAAYRLAWRYWMNPTPELDVELALGRLAEG